MENMDTGKITRYTIILLYLSGGATVQTATPQEYESDESWSIFVMAGIESIMEIFEDELDFLLNDGLIEFSSGDDDPNLSYCYKTYTVTETAWKRFEIIRTRINSTKKTV
jgi:hypothetical protein